VKTILLMAREWRKRGGVNKNKRKERDGGARKLTDRRGVGRRRRTTSPRRISGDGAMKVEGQVVGHRRPSMGETEE